MMWLYLLLLCFTDALGCRSTLDKKKNPKYFLNGAWEGWNPKANSWKEWIKIWAKAMAFDSTEVKRDPESGWPTYWRGLGLGNPGNPAPASAYVPENYGRPSYCYFHPNAGHCENPMGRWAFNPSKNACERFVYNGCGGNENNFMNKYDCTQACGRVPETGCAAMKADFRDFIDLYGNSLHCDWIISFLFSISDSFVLSGIIIKCL